MNGSKFNRFLPFVAAYVLFNFNADGQVIGQNSATEEAESIIGFYNCENLFDTIDTPYKQDYEYLPTSQKRWNSNAYFTKLNHLSRVILGINDFEGPDVIGLCEVENYAVLKDLVEKTNLKHFNYGIIHRESQDVRGIDVACLYKKDHFDLIDYTYISVKSESDESRPTRDILHVRGVLRKADTLHLFFNHWPSRYGGEVQSAPKRKLAALTLRAQVDSLIKEKPLSKIIISGDFNDGTTDSSVANHLGAKHRMLDLDENYLLNTSYHLQHNQNLGSHKFRGEWNLFDQMILSSSLFSERGVIYEPENSFVYAAEWLMEDDVQYFGRKPFRTYSGSNYLGGYSDHFPVYVKLRVVTSKK